MEYEEDQWMMVVKTPTRLFGGKETSAVTADDKKIAEDVIKETLDEHGGIGYLCKIKKVFVR